MKLGFSVFKSDKTLRFCSDFQKVNRVTKSDSFPLPRMENCVDQVGAAKYVSKCDLLKGYWQVPLSKEVHRRWLLLSLHLGCIPIKRCRHGYAMHQPLFNV